MQTPIIPVIADWIRRHPGTISLGQGVVHYEPPQQAAEQFANFTADPENHKYKPVVGLPALQSAWAEKLKRENGLEVAEANGNALVVTAGGNMAFMNAMLAILDPDDEVILPAPYYFNHEMAITMANARPVLVATDSDHQLDLNAIVAAITSRTRAIVTVSPNNPTGAVYPEAALRAVNVLCRERGLYHICDEAYEYFTYDGARHFSPGSIPDSAGHTVSLFSMSKAYGFASWRIGFMVVPTDLLEAVRKIQDTILICAPVVSQFAALGALAAGSDWVRQQIASLAMTRVQVAGELKKLADCCHVPRAEGAFYFLISVRTDKSPLAIVEHLIQNFGVALIPGTAFGLTNGCQLRLAYGALRPDTVAEGVGRFTRGLRAILNL